MIMHANYWYFRQRKILVCSAGSTPSVPAGVGIYGKEARVATAPPDTATTSFAVAVRTAKGRSLPVGAAMFGWARAGTAKMVVERQVHELGVCGFECVCFGGIPR